MNPETPAEVPLDVPAPIPTTPTEASDQTVANSDVDINPQASAETPADIPATPEVIKKERAVSAEQQTIEIGYVGNTLLARQTEVAIGKHSRSEQLTDGEERLLAVYQLSEAKDIDFTQSTDYPEDGYSLTKGNPAYIRYGGRDVQILHIRNKTTAKDRTASFMCTVRSFQDFERTKSSDTSMSITPEQLEKALHLADIQVIKADFSEPEQRLLTMHGEVLKNGKGALEDINPQQTNELLGQVTLEQGIPNSEDYEGLLNSLLPTATPEQQARINTTLTLLSTQNVPTDSAKAAEILGALGCNTESITQQQSQLQSELDLLKTQLVTTPDDEALKEAVSLKEIELSLVEKTLEDLGTSSPDFSKYFKRMGRGEVGKEKAVAIAKGVREGNIGVILKNIIPELMDDPNDTPDQAADKQRKLKELSAKYAGYGALGIGMIFVLLWNLAVIETKEVKKAIK